MYLSILKYGPMKYAIAVKSLVLLPTHCALHSRQFNLSLPQNSPKNATHDYGDWGLAQARVFETWRLVSYWTK